MSIELPDLTSSTVILAIGLIIMGYLIGNGLKSIGQNDYEHPINNLMTKEHLSMYLNLDQKEIDDLLKYPDVPKIILSGTTYYPYKQFVTWLYSIKD